MKNNSRALPQIAYSTAHGKYLIGDVKEVLRSARFRNCKGRFQLILTSPPFPLNRKKSYGNLTGTKYIEWFVSLAPLLSDLLTDDGSIVMELGNSWEAKRPIQSLLHLDALMGFVRHPTAGLRLCQQFACYNPSRLPSPAQWVTVKRIRMVDSFTHVWWMAKSDFPSADNKRVLRPYSRSMQSLLKRGKYNSGKRPSQHRISTEGFLRSCGGSIAHNFIEMDALDPSRDRRLPNAFSFGNTASTDFFTRTCKEKGLIPHPARMPIGLAAFFIQYLTEPGARILDPFAGSNTTGYAAQRLRRHWLAIDAKNTYAQQSKLRFLDPELTNTTDHTRTVHEHNIHHHPNGHL